VARHPRKEHDAMQPRTRSGTGLLSQLVPKNDDHGNLNDSERRTSSTVVGPTRRGHWKEAKPSLDEADTDRIGFPSLAPNTRAAAHMTTRNRTEEATSPGRRQKHAATAAACRGRHSAGSEARQPGRRKARAAGQWRRGSGGSSNPLHAKRRRAAAPDRPAAHGRPATPTKDSGERDGRRTWVPFQMLLCSLPPGIGRPHRSSLPMPAGAAGGRGPVRPPATAEYCLLLYARQVSVLSGPPRRQ